MSRSTSWASRWGRPFPAGGRVPCPPARLWPADCGEAPVDWSPSMPPRTPPPWPLRLLARHAQRSGVSLGSLVAATKRTRWIRSAHGSPRCKRMRATSVRATQDWPGKSNAAHAPPANTACRCAVAPLPRRAVDLCAAWCNAATSQTRTRQPRKALWKGVIAPFPTQTGQ